MCLLRHAIYQKYALFIEFKAASFSAHILQDYERNNNFDENIQDENHKMIRCILLNDLQTVLTSKSVWRFMDVVNTNIYFSNVHKDLLVIPTVHRKDYDKKINGC